MQKIRKSAVLANRLKAYFLFWGFLTIVFASAILVQVRKQSGLSGEIASLTQQLSDANAQQDSLQQKIDSKSSDSSVDDYGHKQLGLAFPDEILIYDENYGK